MPKGAGSLKNMHARVYQYLKSVLIKKDQNVPPLFFSSLSLSITHPLLDSLSIADQFLPLSPPPCTALKSITLRVPHLCLCC